MGAIVVKQYRAFAFEPQGDVVMVRLKDQQSLGFLMTTELREELEDLISGTKPAMLVVNFGDVSSISTAVVGALLKARHIQQAEGREICLSKLSRRVKRVFKLFNLDDTVFKIVDNYEAS